MKSIRVIVAALEIKRASEEDETRIKALKIHPEYDGIHFDLALAKVELTKTLPISSICLPFDHEDVDPINDITKENVMQ